MRWHPAVALALALTFVGGCSQREEVASEDCTVVLEVGSDTFIEVGFTDTPERSLGMASRLPCNDTGPSPEGGAERVEVLSVPGHPPRNVVAIAEGTRTFRVFAADALSDDEEAKLRSDFTE